MSFGLAIYYSAILAAVPYVVEKNTVGTAFGVIGSVIGLSQIITPFVNIVIIDSDEDLAVSYKRLNFAYIFIALSALISAIYINWGPFGQLDQKFEDLEDTPIKEEPCLN